MNRIDIRDQCRNRWASILEMFGVDRAYLTGRQTACPICQEGRDRFRFDDKDGRGTWICNACGAGDGLNLFIKITGRSFREAATAIRERLGETVEKTPKKPLDPERAADALRSLLDGAAPLGLNGVRDGATEYLIGRGLEGPFPMCLRYHPGCHVSDHPSKKVLPAMLALVTGPDGKLVNVHRTYLENGQKARWIAPGDNKETSSRKMMPGDIPPGSAIRLGEPRDGRLGVAEGIETALAVTQRFGMTCWSVANATLLKKFLPPEELRELHVFGDNDRNYTGQAAAYHVAHRASLMRGGPKVVAVHIPQKIGTDWADGLQKAKAA